MRRWRGDVRDRQGADLGKLHGAVARQTLVLGSDLSGLVGELPPVDQQGRGRRVLQKVGKSCSAESIGNSKALGMANDIRALCDA